jgi:flavin reductase (DIM6/NTAB) family NADH-FMN oxidoreductase RutF
MSKTAVPFDRYFSQLTYCLGHTGALLVSRDSAARPNAMTIGWGTVGIIWGKPIFVALVRPSRYTYGCIEATGDFTVCVPYAEMSEAAMFCGTESGRNYDKFAECHFTEIASEAVQSPGIEECGLVYECRVVHKNDVLPPELDSEVDRSCYPSGDYHRLYYGEIVRTIADEDFESRFVME